MITLRKILGSGLFALAGLFMLISLVSAQGSNNPVVVINRPPSGSDYALGDIISIESVSASPVGIVQVDLLIDGALSHSDQTPGELPEVQFSLIQRWLADLPGTHVITVRATDSENRIGQSSINVNVQANTPTPVPPPTVAPSPTPNTCILDARFIRDVTIPDNTTLAPGAPFVKTWTIQNSGTCAWDANTAAVFNSGTRMAGGSPTPVGALAPGATKDISINFVAPTNPGTHRSGWKLQAGNGSKFGETFFAQIIVPGAPPPPQPPPPPPPQPGGCQGAPSISSFTVDNSNIQKGQSTTLRWGFVGNADSVYLQTPDGNGGVPSPGQQGIAPHRTSTYTLAAFCKGARVQAQVTVNVHGGGGQHNGGAQGSINNIEVGASHKRTQVRVFYSWNGADGPAQVCVTARGTDGMPCTNARPNAPYAVLNLNGNNQKVTACLIGRSGAKIACGSN